jgi:hypothetical protein
MKLISTLLIHFILFFYTACNPTQSDIDFKDSFSVADASCTELWIKAHLINLELPAEIQIVVSNDRTEKFSISLVDTLLQIDSLKPGTQYDLEFSFGNNRKINLTTSTLPVTSHNFTWETFYFGDCNSSLVDVSIVDENTIIAVDKINFRDSTGNCWGNIHSYVIWDGVQWKVEKLIVPTYPHSLMLPSDLTSVISFNSNNIFAASAGAVMHWDGTQWNEKGYFVDGIPFYGGITYLWGNSADNFYAGTQNGKLHHYKDNNWTTLETNTNSPITHITGYDDPLTNEQIVFISCSSSLIGSKRKLFKLYEDNTLIEFPWRNESSISGVYTKNGIKTFACGPGIREWDSKRNNWIEIIVYPTVVTSEIKATDYNNIFVLGVLGTIFHFNGETWQTVKHNPDRMYYGLSVKGNQVVAVGREEGRAVLTIGTRN